MTCPICLETIVKANERMGTLFPCKHSFHLECIRRWHCFADKMQCPMCRIPSEKLLVSDDGKNQTFIDLTMGFAISNVLDATSMGFEIERLRRPQEPPHHTQRAYTEYCGVCGDSRDKCILDSYCNTCPCRYHSPCLRTLAVEVGDPESWVQCPECRGLVEVHSPETGTQAGSALDEGQLESTRRAKRLIQGHVRRVLDTCLLPNGLPPMHYTEINKTVSRDLYRLSANRYEAGAIDYDLEARIRVLNALRGLGYGPLSLA